MARRKPRIVTIGGGTGTFTLLNGLKAHPVNLAAIVAMSDSGGSTGMLRTEYGVSPPGDLRQAIVALSDSSADMLAMMTHRFASGTGLRGHTLGNLIISAAEQQQGDIDAAVQMICRNFKVRGEVIPVTCDKTNLVALLENGQELFSEHLIDTPRQDAARIVSTRLQPAAQANPRALAALAKADLIVIGPGDVYTSIIPNLLVEGIPAAINASPAKIVYVCNLMTKPGQTHGLTAHDHAALISEALRDAPLWGMLVNATPPDARDLEYYSREGEEVVGLGVPPAPFPYLVILADLLSSAFADQQPGDAVARSLIRHDYRKLAEAIISLL